MRYYTDIPDNEGNYVLLTVCVCVCVCEQENSKSWGWIWIKYSGSRNSVSALMLLDGWEEGHLACKKLDVGLLVVTIWLPRALHILLLRLSPSPPSSLAPIKSRMETLWYWLIQVHLEKWLLKWSQILGHETACNKLIRFWTSLLILFDVFLGML